MKSSMLWKRAVCSAMAVSMLATSALAWTANKQDLTEVEVQFEEGVNAGPSGWAQAEVDAAGKADLIPKLTGNPAYTDAITREQFAELVVQGVEVMLDRELDTAPEDTFRDSSNPSVRKASRASIVSGVGGEKFDPKTTTNREQIAAMIFRAIRYVEKESGTVIAPNTGSLAGFADQNQVSSWAVEWVGTLAANRIMSGTSATTLSPAKNCTVEESILLCYRVYDRFVKAQ
ncbi:MAG: S-layer homology domain-containing protein [Butyricicoccus sp.]|nr:S-layer homology domain-containing protein [Butyricicoccus sp.]